MMSPLTQGRGSKLTSYDSRTWSKMSPLTQGRGSKLQASVSTTTRFLSPLTQGRGSKHRIDDTWLVHLEVAPHTGAWIETSISFAQYLGGIVAPHTGAWIET